MSKLYEMFREFENSGYSFHELIILSFLISLWDKNQEADSQILVKNLIRFSKSTIHRKLNELRLKNIIDYQVDYNDGRKIKIVKGSEFNNMLEDIEQLLTNIKSLIL